MHRIGVRILAGLLSATLTLGVLSGVASIAGFESSHELQVVVFPQVTVTASRSQLLAEACSEDSERPTGPQECTAGER